MFFMGTKAKAALCGALAGAVNGILGSGGGIILVPLFVSWLRLPSKQAFATSVSVTFVFSIITAAVCIFEGEVPAFSKMLPYLAGGAVGGFLSGKLLKTSSPVFLHRIFGALLIFGGIKALL